MASEKSAGSNNDETSIWCRIDDLLLVVSRSGESSPVAFEQLLVALRDPAVRCVLGLSYGDGTTTSDQRRKLAEALADKPAAAMTESTVTRGILTALRWLGSKVKPFSHSELEQALEYLECSCDAARVQRRARELMLAAGWIELSRRLAARRS